MKSKIQTGFIFYGSILIMGLFVLSCFSQQYGFTRLCAFRESDALPRYSAVGDSVYVMKGKGGYDGQYYAQIALNPSLSDPKLKDSIDDLSYRARRIGMPVAAWLLGMGQPWWVLQVYSLLNVLMWIGLAFFLKSRLNHLADGESCMRWWSCMFSVGVLDSVRQSLTDFPSTALIILCFYSMEEKKRLRGIWMACMACLVKETSILLIASHTPRRLEIKAWRNYLGSAFLITLPLLLWFLYLNHTIGFTNGVKGNFGFPMVSMAHYVSESFTRLQGGHFSIHTVFGLAGVVSGLIQVCLLAQWREWHNPWWRLAALNALLFLVAGDSVWSSTMASLRITLPMTFIVCLKMPKCRGWMTLMVLISLPTIHGFIRWMFNT